MKVLHVLPTLSAGGAESFITRLCCALQENPKCEVAIFIPGGIRGTRGEVLKSELEQAGVKIFGGGERSMRDWRHLFRLLSVIRTFRPDIVQANLYSSEVLCSIARWLCVFTNIVFVRRLANTAMSAEHQPILGRYLYRSFGLSIACSEATQASYLEYLGKISIVNSNDSAGIVMDKIVSIENGVNIPDTVPERTQAREQLSLPENAFVVCHVGRFTVGPFSPEGGLASGQKAHDVIIRSFAVAFGGLGESAHLLLVGDGPLRIEAEQLAAELQVAHQVHFLGVQPNPWQALAAADVFFFPSRCEGMPNALVEAACIGLPVVASDIPEINSINLAGNWVLCPVDDVHCFSGALNSTRDDIEELRAVGKQAAPTFKERFSIDTCAQKYVATYLRLVSSEG